VSWSESVGSYVVRGTTVIVKVADAETVYTVEMVAGDTPEIVLKPEAGDTFRSLPSECEA
jgi:hypothetical protein